MGSGIVLWLFGGFGLVLMIAAYRNQSIGDVLTGKTPAGTSPAAAVTAQTPVSKILKPVESNTGLGAVLNPYSWTQTHTTSGAKTNE